LLALDISKANGLMGFRHKCWSLLLWVQLCPSPSCLTYPCVLDNFVLLGNNRWLSRFQNQLQPPDIIPIRQYHLWACLYHYLSSSYMLCVCAIPRVYWLYGIHQQPSKCSNYWWHQVRMVSVLYADNLLLFVQIPSVQCDFHTLQWDINTVAEWVSGNHSKFS